LKNKKVDKANKKRKGEKEKEQKMGKWRNKGRGCPGPTRGVHWYKSHTRRQYLHSVTLPLLVLASLAQTWTRWKSTSTKYRSFNSLLSHVWVGCGWSSMRNSRLCQTSRDRILSV